MLKIELKIVDNGYSVWIDDSRFIKEIILRDEILICGMIKMEYRIPQKFMDVENINESDILNYVKKEYLRFDPYRMKHFK